MGICGSKPANVAHASSTQILGMLFFKDCDSAW